MADIRNRTLTLADCRFDWVFHGYDTAFEGQGTFSDIDGVIYHNGHFLFIEHKSMSADEKPSSLPKGQLKLYRALSLLPNSTCYLVGGDMKESVPFYIEQIGGKERIMNLRGYDKFSARAALRDILIEWYIAANNNPEERES